MTANTRYSSGAIARNKTMVNNYTYGNGGPVPRKQQCGRQEGVEPVRCMTISVQWVDHFGTSVQDYFGTFTGPFRYIGRSLNYFRV